jgi:ATP-dependent RNA helicase SUPV3L1/SUV3
VRLAEAPDAQFALAADGTIRWTGAAVGKLIAGEEVLRPRVAIIADEHLSGAPREAVAARLEQWVKSHIEKLLGALFELSASADVSGIARGVAFQLVEALGVLDRQRVAEDVKGLQQPERATLRKYGVRFGAYHIYLPLLLKPAPRALAAQLWALRHDGPQTKGLDDLLHLAAGGRTSFPVNREIDAALYRTAGYRICGERAVRVDILERLTDLIRPALAWRDGSSLPKPPGAFAGGGFTVVNTMTSLTGASGEDFASILRSLGYRVEQRPKPAEPDPAPAQIMETAAPQEAEAQEAEPQEAEAQDAAPAEPAVQGAEQSGAESAVEILPPGEAEVDAPAEPIVESDDPAPAELPVEAVAAASDAAVISSPTEAGTESAPEAAPASSEPVLIDVWRPGRAEGRRRPNFRRRGARKETAQPPAAAAADAATPAAPTGETTTAPQDIPAEAAAEQPPREGRHFRQRRRGAADRGDRPRRERERPPAHVARHERPERKDRYERREKAPDPNSPFAKLAALKAQLEADAKERR